VSILADRVAREAPRKRPTRKQIRLAREFDIDIAKYERGFRVDIFKVLKKLGDDVSDVALEVLSDEKNLKKDAGRDAMLAGEIAKRLNVAGFETDMRVVYEKNYTRIMRATQKRINATMDLGISILDTAETRILAEGGKRVGMLDMGASAKKRVYEELATGRSKGEAVAQLARRLRDKIPAGRFKKPQTRATLIARTETTYAQKMAAAESYRQGGVTEVMIMDSRKGSFDDECDAMDGRIVSLQEGEALMSEEHPNGTRRMVAQPPKLDEPSLKPTAELNKLPIAPEVPLSPKWETASTMTRAKSQLRNKYNIGELEHHGMSATEAKRVVNHFGETLAKIAADNPILGDSILKKKAGKLKKLVLHGDGKSFHKARFKAGGTGSSVGVRGFYSPSGAELHMLTHDTYMINTGRTELRRGRLRVVYDRKRKALPLETKGLQLGGDKTYSFCETVEDAFRHEYGHHVFFSNANNAGVGQKVAGRWEKFYDMGTVRKTKKFWKGFMTEYSSTKMIEGFAESFAAYTHPEYKLIQNSTSELSQLTKFMQNNLKKKKH